jgi:hypothetical protein
MDLLKCPICKDRFKSTPIFLPCGWTVCDTHVSNSSLTNGCSMCGDKHSDSSEYRVNKPVAIQLNLQRVAEKLDRTADKLARFKAIQRDPLAFVSELSEELVNQVLSREVETIRSLHARFSSTKKSIHEMANKYQKNSTQV